VAKALQAFAHSVGSYQDKNTHMVERPWVIQTSAGLIIKTRLAEQGQYVVRLLVGLRQHGCASLVHDHTAG
jgi:hypothetical protein